MATALNVTCSSSGSATCHDQTNAIAAGYYCESNHCHKCMLGTYGTDGKVCKECPPATWTQSNGSTDSTACASFFTYQTPGSHELYIPIGVRFIDVQLWGGGGGGDSSMGGGVNYISRSGGSGGYAACSVKVLENTTISLIVAGGGGANYTATTYGLNLGGEYMRSLVLTDWPQLHSFTLLSFCWPLKIRAKFSCVV